MALPVETGGRNDYETGYKTEISFHNVLRDAQFRSFFNAPVINPPELVLLFDNEHKRIGFGVVGNSLAVTTTGAGTFGRVPPADMTLLTEVKNIRNHLRRIHSDANVRRDPYIPPPDMVNILRFPYWLMLKGVLDYFQTCSLCYDYKVVMINCSSTMCGFGFIEGPRVTPQDRNLMDYLNWLREKVHFLKHFILDNVTLGIDDWHIVEEVHESVHRDILAQRQRQHMHIGSVIQPTTAPTTFQTVRQQLYGNIHDPAYGGPSNTDSRGGPLRVQRVSTSHGGRLARGLPYPIINSFPHYQRYGTRQAETNEMIPNRSTDSVRDFSHVSYGGSMDHNSRGRFAADHQRIGSNDMTRQGVRIESPHQGVRIGRTDMTHQGGRNDKILYTTPSTISGPNRTDAVTTGPVTGEFALHSIEWPPLSGQQRN